MGPRMLTHHEAEEERNAIFDAHSLNRQPEILTVNDDALENLGDDLSLQRVSPPAHTPIRRRTDRSSQDIDTSPSRIGERLREVDTGIGTAC